MEDMPKRWVIFTLFVYCIFRATRYKKKLKSSGRKIIGLQQKESRGTDIFGFCFVNRELKNHEDDFADDDRK